MGCSVDDGQLFWQLHLHLHLLFLRHSLDILQRTLHHLRQRHGLEFLGDLSCLDPRHVQQVAGQIKQLSDAVATSTQHLPLFLVDLASEAPQDHLKIALNSHQGGL